MKSPVKRIAAGVAAAILATLIIVYPLALVLSVGLGVIQIPDLDGSWPQWAFAASLPLWAKLLLSAIGLAAPVFLAFFAATWIAGATTDREGLGITAIATIAAGFQSRSGWDFGLSPILLLIYVITGLAGAMLGTRIRRRSTDQTDNQ